MPVSLPDGCFREPGPLPSTYVQNGRPLTLCGTRAEGLRSAGPSRGRHGDHRRLPRCHPARSVLEPPPPPHHVGAVLGVAGPVSGRDERETLP